MEVQKMSVDSGFEGEGDRNFVRPGVGGVRFGGRCRS